MSSNSYLKGTAKSGQKTLRGSGIDSSSMGEKSVRSVINSENGDAMKDTGLNRSIRDGKVPGY
jgi:hypothetical protein